MVRSRFTACPAIEDAGPGDLTFFTNPKYAAELRATRASAVILSPDAAPAPCAMLRHPQPYLAFARAVELFADGVAAARRRASARRSSAPACSWATDASVGPFAVIGEGARDRRAARSIYPHVVIGRHAQIGDDCVLHARVSIRERVRIGHRVVDPGRRRDRQRRVRVRAAAGRHAPQDPADRRRGRSKTTSRSARTRAIDRPAVGETRIGAGTKIDNLVQVAHGVTIGRNVLLAAQVGVAGSTTIEDDVTLAGQVGVAGHITDRQGRRSPPPRPASRTRSTPGAFISGYPAIANRDWLKSSAVFRRLPELRKTARRARGAHR